MGKIVNTDDIMTALCQHCDSHIEMCEECGMREIVESVPSAWISVKDRLPDGDESVLVCFSEGGIDMAYFNGKDFDYMFLHPTHWMPLPDAPEVEE